MGSQQSDSSSPRERVIVVMDAKGNKVIMDALDWALKRVVRPRDTVIVLGILCDITKKNSWSCFPLNMGISISGIWERLEFSSGHPELNPKELGEEIERKREQYQTYVQPFYRQCKRNEVKLEIKLAAGWCAKEITVKEAQNSNTRWVVLDSHLKKHRLYIFGHVGCNVAVMKGKHVATLMTIPKPDNSPDNYARPEDETYTTNQSEDQNEEQTNACQEEESSIQPPPSQSPCWYPLQWRSGFPREFTLTELEEITNGFADENFNRDLDDVKIYEGILKETPVLVQSFAEDDDRFWSMLMILFRLRHRNIMNLVGYCCKGTSRFFIMDFPCLGNLEINLKCDQSARNLPWKARWYTAQEIGGSLRYLHEECPDGPIVHLSVCSSNIVFSHGCSALLSNFRTAKWLKDDTPCNENSTAGCRGPEVEECLSADVHDYGMFLVELISGKSARCFPDGEGQSLIDWALPLLKNGSLDQVMDPRLKDTSDTRAVHHMVQAALLCLNNDLDCRLSISEVLAVVQGDQLPLSNC